MSPLLLKFQKKDDHSYMLSRCSVACLLCKMLSLRDEIKAGVVDKLGFDILLSYSYGVN